jgi:hypothetical protein
MSPAKHWRFNDPWYRRLPPITLHGIGWFIALVVNLLTLWLVAHGGHL